MIGNAIMDTDRAWKRWGEQDPYFGVLSVKEFRRENIADHKSEFMRTGEGQIAALMENVEEHFGSLARERALDFGCGVGRLVAPLAQRFEHVVGVDISEAMLAEAAKNCAFAGGTNVSFVLSDDRLSQVHGSFNLVHSSLVLQHIPENRGLMLIDRLLGLLKPRGVAALHVSLSRHFRFPKNVAYFLRHHVPLAGTILNFLQGERLSRPAIRMSQYSLPAVLELYRRHGIEAPFIQPHDGGEVIAVTIIGMAKATPSTLATTRAADV